MLLPARWFPNQLPCMQVLQHMQSSMRKLGGNMNANAGGGSMAGSFLGSALGSGVGGIMMGLVAGAVGSAIGGKLSSSAQQPVVSCDKPVDLYQTRFSL